MLVETASPAMSGWGITPRAAYGVEGGAAVLVADAPEAVKRPQLVSTVEPAPVPAAAPSLRSAAPATAAEPQASKGFLGLFARSPADAAPATAQRRPSVSEQALPQPQPAATVASLADIGAGATPGRQETGDSASMVRGGTRGGEVDKAGKQREGDGQGEERAASKGEGSVLQWVSERAALVAVGGLAGVAVVRALSSRPARAGDVDSEAASTASAAAAPAARNPAVPAPGPAPPAGPPAAAAGPQQGAPPRAPYAGYDDDSGEYGAQWDEVPRAGSGSRRRVPGRSPSAGSPHPQGRWPRSGSPSGATAGRTWVPGPAGAPYGDAAEYDAYEGVPPPGPYYGPMPPPPWWHGPYPDYERYGAYDGPYGQTQPPPPYRGYGWDEGHGDAEAGPGGAAGEPQDPYYYYGAPPPSYWSRGRWGQRPPYDLYEPPYGTYDGPPQALPPLPPPQPGRGFAGMRVSPGKRLGRNPWSAVEQEDPAETQPAAYGVGAGAAGASPARGSASAPGSTDHGLSASGAMDLEDLEEMDATLAQLQAQIDELQGVGGTGATSSAVAGAASAAKGPTKGKDGGKDKGMEEEAKGEGRPAARRTVVRDWRTQLQEDEGLWERQRQQRQWRQQDEQEQLDSREEEGRLQGLYDEDEAVAQVAEEARARAATGVPSAADREYERLLQMWREAHKDDDPEQAAASGGGAAAAGTAASGKAARRRGRQQPTPPEAAQLSEEGPKDVDNDLPNPPAVIKSSGLSQEKASRPAGAGGDAVAGGEGDGVPAPQPVEAAAPRQEQEQEPSAGGGRVGWLARMFRSLKGSSGGRDGSRGDDSQELPQQQKRQETPQAAADEPRDAAAADEMRQPQQQAEEEAPWGALHAPEQQAEETRRQREERPELQVQVKPEAEAAEQAAAGAALAAAVEAALKGQLVEQQAAAAAASVPAPAPAPAAPSTTVQQEAVAQSAAAAPPPPPETEAAAVAAAAGPSRTRPPLPPAVGTHGKESIQQLKATSAAAADRAAETLARIRAMRAAAQAVGSRSGSGNRTRPNGGGDAGGNTVSINSKRSGTGAVGERSIFNANGGGGKAEGGKGVEVEGRDGALAAEIAASQATQSDVTTEAPEAQRAIDGSLREAAEVH